MPDDFRPRHLRRLPSNVKLTSEEEREHMDLQTDLDRVRRKHLSEHSPDAGAVGLPRPAPDGAPLRPAPLAVHRAEAEEAGESAGARRRRRGRGAGQMRRLELVSDAPRRVREAPRGEELVLTPASGGTRIA